MLPKSTNIHLINMLLYQLLVGSCYFCIQGYEFRNFCYSLFRKYCISWNTMSHKRYGLVKSKVCEAPKVYILLPSQNDNAYMCLSLRQLSSMMSSVNSIPIFQIFPVNIFILCEISNYKCKCSSQHQDKSLC